MLAIAAARSLGISIEDAAAGIARTPALPMRSAWVEIGRFTVINDAYNANPASARESLRMLAALDTTRQRVAILGSMLELGAAGPALHDEIASLALRGPAEIIAGVGEFARALNVAAPNDSRIVTAADAPDLWPAMSQRLAPDAVILLKGSRGTRLERLIPHDRSGFDPIAPVLALLSPHPADEVRLRVPHRPVHLVPGGGSRRDGAARGVHRRTGHRPRAAPAAECTRSCAKARPTRTSRRVRRRRWAV